MPYKIIEHTADIGLQIRASDLPSLFFDAAAGLYELMTDSAAITQIAPAVTIELQAGNAGDLFLKWMRELLFLFSARRIVAKEIHFKKISDNQLQAEIRPALFDPKIHEQRSEVKAVTYHAFQFEKNSSGWFAQVILDI